MTIKIKKDLRHLFGPVRDQGQRPTCLAFAASDAHAALRGAWAPLSCEYAFFCARTGGGRAPQGGAFWRWLLGALRGEGRPHKRGGLSLVAVPADVGKWQPPAGATPLFRRAGDAGSDTVDAILH